MGKAKNWALWIAAQKPFKPPEHLEIGRLWISNPEIRKFKLDLCCTGVWPVQFEFRISGFEIHNRPISKFSRVRVGLIPVSQRQLRSQSAVRVRSVRLPEPAYPQAGFSR